MRFIITASTRCVRSRDGASIEPIKNRINLARRALYDLWNTAPDDQKPQYETDDRKYNTMGRRPPVLPRLFL